ncbi:MAG: hypothetical protein IJH61_04505 [Eubacteriaceae bacterium]|nr:hypothetical protein [Eubacteriaceae bacterium]
MKKKVPSDERVSTTAERLQFYLQKHNLKQVDIARMCQPLCEKYNIRLQRNDINQYVRGIARPSSDRLTILSKALGVPEIWLLGYNIPQDLPIKEDKSEKEDEEYDFFLIANDESLINEHIYKGDIVYFKKQNIGNNGDLVAVMLDEKQKPIMKRMYYYHKDQNIVILKTSNPCEDVICNVNDPTFSIVGKAIAFKSNHIK